MKTPPTEPNEPRSVREEDVLAVREGPSANCSSIGSVVDTLFVTAVVGGALFAAIAAAVQREKGAVRVVGAHGLDAEDEEANQKEEKERDAPPT